MRIVHISDLHIEPEPERRFPGSWRSLERDRSQLARLAPDLVIVSGDVTNFGAYDRDHLVLAKEWIDTIGLPTLTVPGNHDLGPSVQRALTNQENEAYQDVPYPETHFGSVFLPSPVVSHDLGAVRVVGIGLREGDPDGALPRLERLLAADERPVILCGHYPVVPARETRASDEFGTDEFLPTTGPALLEIVRAHPNVRAYVCGHVHVNSVRPVAGHCVQITAGGLGPGASTFRLYDVDGTGLTYSTLLGSGPLTFWERAVTTALGPDYSLGTSTDRTGRITWSLPSSRA